MDRICIVFLQKILQHHQVIIKLISYVAKFGYWLYLLYGAIEWLRPGTPRQCRQRHHTLLSCISAVAIGSITSFVLGRLWKRERPFVQHPEVQDIIPHKANASFPSNHSMNAMAASTMLLSCHNWWGIPLLVWSLFIGISRVVCGLHYVSDVLGGFVMGITSTFLVRHNAVVKKAVEMIGWDVHIVSKFLQVWWKKC